MRKPVLLCLAIATLIIWGCAQEAGENRNSVSKDEFLADIAEKEAHYEELGETEKDRIEEAIALIAAYREFGERFPEHEKSPEYFYHAANLSAHAIGNYNDAVELFEVVYETYPEHEKAPASLITSAFLMEGPLDNKARARLMYQQFLEDYPDHELREDAAFALDVLDKSPDEILREFKEREAEREQP